MVSEIPPQIGDWYRRPDRRQPFRVVAYDADTETVEVEYFDGTVDEWPLEHWLALDIVGVASPLSWTGPFDDLEAEDVADDAVHGPPGSAHWVEDLQAEVERRVDEAEALQPQPLCVPAHRREPSVSHRHAAKPGRKSGKQAR